MVLWVAIGLAVLQGVTEFLPVSSSGHLVLAAELIELPMTGAERESFFVLLHFASFLAVIVYMARDIGALLRGPERGRVIAAVGIGCIPAAIAGVLIKVSGQTGLFESAWIAGGAWLVTAALLWSLRRAPEATFGPFDAGFGRGAGILLLIGLAQACALAPGISRSGATIAVAMLLGMRREEAFRFSFLMALPLILGAQVLDLEALGELSRVAAPASLAAAFAVCFAVSLACLWILARAVRGGRLQWFAPYCAAIGILTLVLCATGAIS